MSHSNSAGVSLDLPASTQSTTTKQLNVDVDSVLLASLTAICQRDRTTKREIIEMLVSAWLAASEGRGTRHLDGSECPLSKLISGLEECLLARMR